MEYLIVWLLFSIGVAALAANRGQNAVVYFLVSLLLSPLIGLIILVVSKPKPSTAEQMARLEAAKAGGLVTDDQYKRQAAIIAQGGQLTAQAITGKREGEWTCGRCGKRISPYWKSSCGHCGAAFSDFPPVPRAEGTISPA